MQEFLKKKKKKKKTKMQDKNMKYDSMAMAHFKLPIKKDLKR